MTTSVHGEKGEGNDERIWICLCSAWRNNRIICLKSSKNVKGEKMASEIIVEFPTPLTDKEKKMIYGYKGEVVRCKDCFYRDGNACDYSAVYVRPNGYCQWGRREEDEDE